MFAGVSTKQTLSCGVPILQLSWVVHAVCVTAYYKLTKSFVQDQGTLRWKEKQRLSDCSSLTYIVRAFFMHSLGLTQLPSASVWPYLGHTAVLWRIIWSETCPRCCLVLFSHTASSFCREPTPDYAFFLLQRQVVKTQEESHCLGWRCAICAGIKV
jgi:hypothetical protein